MLPHEIIVALFRIRAAYPIDFFRLPRRQCLARVETPDPFQQSLPSKHFVDSGDTPELKFVSGVEVKPRWRR